MAKLFKDIFAPALAGLGLAPRQFAALPGSAANPYPPEPSSRESMSVAINQASNGFSAQQVSGFPMMPAGWQPQQPIPDFGALPGGARLPMAQQTGFPAVLGAMGLALPFIPGAVRAAIGVIRSVGGRILGVMLPTGVKVSRASAVELAKRMGVTAAATALGIGAVEMAEMIMQDSAKRRRGRGVTAAQIRTTRRTMRVVMGLHKQITSACSSAGFRTRARARTRTVFISKGKS